MRYKHIDSKNYKARMLWNILMKGTLNQITKYSLRLIYRENIELYQLLQQELCFA